MESIESSGFRVKVGGLHQESNAESIRFSLKGYRKALSNMPSSCTPF